MNGAYGAALLAFERMQDQALQWAAIAAACLVALWIVRRRA